MGKGHKLRKLDDRSSDAPVSLSPGSGLEDQGQQQFAKLDL